MDSIIAFHTPDTQILVKRGVIICKVQAKQLCSRKNTSNVKSSLQFFFSFTFNVPQSHLPYLFLLHCFFSRLSYFQHEAYRAPDKCTEMQHE